MTSPNLALALANAATVDDAIHSYEKTMVPRSIEIAEMLDGAAEQLLSTESPDIGDDFPGR